MPEPLITWTQNGRPVNENKVNLQQGGRSLIVNNVDRADAGEYICRAQNAAGQDMQKYELEIHIPPKIIEGSPTETSFKETIRGENLELSCDFDFTYPKECFRSRKLSLINFKFLMERNSHILKNLNLTGTNGFG